MTILDDTKQIQALDRSHSLASIQQLTKQCDAVWDAAKSFSAAPQYKHASSILFCGMGGSAYGARIVRSLYAGELTVPTELVSDYHIPSYVNDNTLVILASYSGTTEETLSCAQEASEKEALLVGITSGGLLPEVLARSTHPVLRFTPTYNPSMQPRLGQGYMQMGLLAILTSLGYLRVGDKEVAGVIEELEKRNSQLDLSIPTVKNPAKHLAESLQDSIVTMIGAEFLQGAIHAIRNPFNETAKHFANYYIVPELNHHLMEGLMYPKSMKETTVFVFIKSSLYSENIRKRMELTRDVVTQNGIKTIDIYLTSDTKLGQVFELIQIGSYLTFYLAMLHGVDPTQIPWVDYFKEKLKKG